MLASAIIVFREVLEASLIIGLVLAATRGIAGRGRWIGLGIAFGCCGAALVAYFAESLAALAEGAGQELFNAGILLLAVGMLGWHQIWMARNAQSMRETFKALGRSVHAGEKTLRGLALVVGAALLREGSEAILFLYGIAASDSDSSLRDMVMGGLGGLGLGALCGAALYLGLLRISPRYLFAVTGTLIMLLAGSMASQAAGMLAQADWLPTLADPLWDTSHVLTRNSPLGQLLHILIGYDDRPTGIALLAYVTTVVTIFGMARTVKRRTRGSTAPTHITNVGRSHLSTGPAMSGNPGPR